MNKRTKKDFPNSIQRKKNVLDVCVLALDVDTKSNEKKKFYCVEKE